MKTKIFTITFLLISSVLFSQVPQTMDYSGKLTDDNGSFINGQVDLTFKLYDVATGGTALWQETQSAVNVSNGYFHVQLGSDSTFTAGLFHNTDLWLGTKVNDDNEMTPRSKLASVPFSQSSAEWTKSGDDIYRLDGNVGIGTASPTGKIHINSETSDCAVKIESTDAQVDLYMLDNSTSDGGLRLSGVGNNLVLQRAGGNVGIGTTSLGAKLDVYARQNNSGTGLLIDSRTRDDSENAFEVRGHYSSDDVVIKTNGNVGIGTTSPGAKLHVENPSGLAAIFGNIEHEDHYIQVRNGTSGAIFLGFDSSLGYNLGGGLLQGGENKGIGFAVNSDTFGATPSLYINMYGNVGIGTTVPSATLSVNGSANKSGGGTWDVFSDARSKENVKNYTKGLDELLQLRPVNYNYREEFGWGDKTYVGLIAQEVEKVVPTMVNEIEVNNIQDFRELDPNELTYMLINAVKEQQKQIEEQQKQIEELKLQIGSAK